ncbi:hypothetical protein PtB15_10B646 [Puccinia triticina]|nr:hypothetical protein PtB15_10B646 [Puccinia triticina]
MAIPPKKTSNQQDPSWKRSKGFRIGKNKPGVSQSVYLGKAEKIKKTLIHKAKLKKQRAKELVKAGYSASSDRTPESRTADNEEEEQPSERADRRDSQPGPASSRRPQNNPKPPTRPANTSKHPSNQPNQQSPKASAQVPHSSSSSTLMEPNPQSARRGRHQDHRSNNLHKNPIKPPKARIQHANGQPKLSHRVSKILSKLEREKDQ